MSKTVKITRLITNQLIIGKVEESSAKIIIEQPFEVIPTVDGIQMLPLDEHILGTKLNIIEIPQQNVLYCNECAQDITNSYLTSISGIEVPEKTLII